MSCCPRASCATSTGTRWDFRKLRPVGGVYDNCWVLDGPRGTLKHGLTLKDPVSGRRMEVWTTEPGMQMYTAEHWNAGFPGKTGPLQQYGAIAIEPQNLPDAPSHKTFPSAELRPGEVYRHRMEWRFFSERAHLRLPRDHHPPIGVIPAKAGIQLCIRTQGEKAGPRPSPG